MNPRRSVSRESPQLSSTFKLSALNGVAPLLLHKLWGLVGATTVTVEDRRGTPLSGVLIMGTGCKFFRQKGILDCIPSYSAWTGFGGAGHVFLIGLVEITTGNIPLTTGK